MESYIIKYKTSQKSTQAKKYIQPNQSDLTLQIRCVRQKCSIKRDIERPVAIHDVPDVSLNAH